MGELIKPYHDFENAKEEIKKLSEQTTKDLDLKRVDDYKGVGEFFGDWFLGRGFGTDHLVKGKELNELTTQIQTHLYSINNTQNKLIKEFGHVYSTLEALDKDYIQAVLISINATDETSESVQKAREQIKRIVENQRKTLVELKKSTQKLDGDAHLGDIYKIWSDCQKWHKDMASLTKEISTATELSKDNIKRIDVLRTALTSTKKKTEDLSIHFSQMIEKLESITAFTSALEKVTHLQDVDEMWESLVTAHSSLESIGSNIEVLQRESDKHQEEINKIFTFVKQVSSVKHLMDVDSTWTTIKEHSEQLTDMEKQNEAIAASVQQSKEDVEVKIAEANIAIYSLTKKIKYAYLIAGGAAVLAIIELILLMVLR